jgi:hypothetical protein
MFISFLREKAHWIGWVVFVFFGVTILSTGSFFFSDAGESIEQQENKKKYENAIAIFWFRTSFFFSISKIL